MLRSRHSWVLRYGVALFASLVALVLTQFLWPYIQPALYPFFLAAVMLSSWFGGLGPGLVTTLLAVGLSEYFFLPPIESIAIGWANLGRIIYFAAVATLICILNYREQLARREAEAANQSKDEFLAILSHELRTPLTAITGWVGMLRSGKLDALRTRMALETIERNPILQMQLVEDLLDISRIIRGDLWGQGQGATFTVKLSLYRLEEHAAPIKPCSEQSLEARLQGLSVLVVDDEVDTRNWLKTVFEMHQARVATAPSVDEALSQLDRAVPDIVISDIAMSGKDGYGLMDQLRQREKQLGRSIPAIALTSHASLTEIEKSRVAGFQHYLTKPVTAEALIAVILQQLEPVQPSRGSAP